MAKGEYIPPLAYGVEGAFDVQQDRRNFLKLVGGVALYKAIGLGIDYRTDQLWPSEVTQIQTVEKARYPERLEGQSLAAPWGAIAGYGRQGALDVASDLAYDLLGVPKQPAMSGGLRHPNQGVFLDESADRFDDYTRDSEGLKLILHSLGFIQSVYMLLNMKHPKHVDEMIVISGPTELDDVIKADAVRIIVESEAPADVATKFLYSLIADFESPREHFHDRALDVLMKAWRNANGGVSPMICLDQLYILFYAQVRRAIPELVKRGIISSNTKFTSCITESDGTVHYRRAGNSLREIFTDPSVKTQFNELVFVGKHADTKAALKAMSTQESRDRRRWES